jgi:hypothetical protein
MEESLQDKLRRIAQEIRRKPVALYDFIPMILEAADRIDSLENDIDALIQHK